MGQSAVGLVVRFPLRRVDPLKAVEPWAAHPGGERPTAMTRPRKSQASPPAMTHPRKSQKNERPQRDLQP